MLERYAGLILQNLKKILKAKLIGEANRKGEKTANAKSDEGCLHFEFL